MERHDGGHPLLRPRKIILRPKHRNKLESGRSEVAEVDKESDDIEPRILLKVI